MSRRDMQHMPTARTGSSPGAAAGSQHDPRAEGEAVMKSGEIEIGGIYTTKVGIRSVDVRIERENPKGGFDAVSVASGKPIRVKDAARLKPAKAEANADAEEVKAERPAKAPKRAKQPKAEKQPKEKQAKEP